LQDNLNRQMNSYYKPLINKQQPIPEYQNHSFV